MTVTTNERGQQNLFAREPRMYVDQTAAERMVTKPMQNVQKN